jgi:adenylyltransferase/sulfurtransferase
MNAPHRRLSPLVEPGPALTDAQRRRYARHVSLAQVGEAGQRRLCNASVAVVGAGGLGSPVISYLAAAGVGRLGIIDGDVVDLSNLQRQTIHCDADVGTSKAHSAAAAVARLNPEVDVAVHAEWLTAANAEQILGRYQLVVDGTDNTATRYLVNDACVALGLPEVWGAIEQIYGQVAVFWGRPPASIGIDPVQLRDVFPDDREADPDRSCARAGVLGALCGSVGSVMATEAIKLIVGSGEPLLGRLLMIDDWSGTQRTVPIRSARPAGGVPTPAIGRASTVADPPPATEGPSTPADPPAPALVDITALDLALALDGTGAWTTVDVRPADERATPPLPGALNISLTDVADGTAARALTAVPGPVAVYCHNGIRSLVAARQLRAQGVDAHHLVGGALAWQEVAGNYALGD